MSVGPPSPSSIDLLTSLFKVSGKYGQSTVERGGGERATREKKKKQKNDKEEERGGGEARR